MDINNFSLAELKENQLELILDWRNSDNIRSVMYNDKIITLEEHFRWFKSLQGSDRTIVKILYYLDKPIGLVNFNKINRQNNVCYWGFYIGDENAPKGSGTILGYLALEFMFEKQNMRKVCSEIISTNTNSIKFHKKMGFVKEGCLVAQIYKHDRYLDVVLMAHFKQDWLKIRDEIKEVIRRYYFDE